MNPSPQRRFTILDAMILVVATAAALAFVRATGLAFSTPAFSASRAKAASLVLHQASMAMPFLIVWTLAFFVIRLSPPRPRLRRLARRPGTAACLAATFAAALQAGWLLIVAAGVVDPVGKGWIPLPKYVFQVFGDVIPYSILGAWSTLAMTGWPRAGSDPVDRLGSFLAVGWVVAVATKHVCLFLILRA